MRVYEFAREKGMKSKDIIGICHELGIEVKAQSKLNIEELEILSRQFNVLSEKGADLGGAVKSEAELELSNVSKDVAYIVCECEPFTKLGELGKKSAEFIKQIQEQGNKPVVILPRYSFISDELEHLVDVSINRGQKKRQATLFRLVRDGVTYLFIGDDDYFNRENIYGYGDDVARFAFFNRAILECLPLIGRRIYDFYLNDWQTSIFALLLKVEFSAHPYYSQIKTNLNIHDLNHQGWCDVNHLSTALGISEEYYSNGLTRMGDAVNLLKSGIETANTISLTKLSERQMKCSEMVESGMSAVLERNLKIKAV